MERSELSEWGLAQSLSQNRIWRVRPYGLKCEIQRQQIANDLIMFLPINWRNVAQFKLEIW